MMVVGKLSTGNIEIKITAYKKNGTSSNLSTNGG
jgi:hypothetical protein